MCPPVITGLSFGVYKNHTVTDDVASRVHSAQRGHGVVGERDSPFEGSLVVCVTNFQWVLEHLVGSS